MKKFFTLIKNEFKGYNSKSFASDLMAGITVAAVALPLALAFGVSSGADATAGLITAIIAGLVIGSLSGGYFQISGPTGAMAVVLMSVVAQNSLEGVFIATLLAGIILLLAGIFKMGNLTSFIPMPVITGFTSGIAIIIALGQIDNFFGVHSVGMTTIEKLLSYSVLGFSPNFSALALGLFVVLFMMFFPKKWGAIVPASLLSIIIATIIAQLFNLDIATVGKIPQSIIAQDRLTIAGINLPLIIELLPPAITIAILGMIESLLCGASASRMTGSNLDSNQELIAQGIGNIILPFFGGIPATAAIARTSVAIKSGAKTRVAGIIHAIALLAFMMLLAPIMSKIPMACLAGVLMVTAFKMNEWKTIKYIFQGKFKSAIFMFLATMITTIIFDLTFAILIGVAISLIHMVSKLANLEIAYADVDLSRLNINDKKFENNKKSVVVYISGPIIFANAQKVENIINNVNTYEKIYLSIRGVSDMDITGSQSMMLLVEKLKNRGCEVYIAGLSTKVKLMSDKTGFSEIIGRDCIYWSIDKALLDEKNT